MVAKCAGKHDLRHTQLEPGNSQWPVPIGLVRQFLKLELKRQQTADRTHITEQKKALGCVLAMTRALPRLLALECQGGEGRHAKPTQHVVLILALLSLALAAATPFNTDLLPDPASTFTKAWYLQRPPPSTAPQTPSCAVLLARYSVLKEAPVFVSAYSPPTCNTWARVELVARVQHKCVAKCTPYQPPDTPFTLGVWPRGVDISTVLDLAPATRHKNSIGFLRRGVAIVLAKPEAKPMKHWFDFAGELRVFVEFPDVDTCICDFPYNVAVTAKFFATTAAYPKPDAAGIVLPMLPRIPVENTTTTLSPSPSVAVKTATNIKRAVLEVRLIYSQTGFPYAPFAVHVLLDGVVADVTFGKRPVDITPFVSVLNDGHKHRIAFVCKLKYLKTTAVANGAKGGYKVDANASLAISRFVTCDWQEATLGFELNYTRTAPSDEFLTTLSLFMATSKNVHEQNKTFRPPLYARALDIMQNATTIVMKYYGRAGAPKHTQTALYTWSQYNDDVVYSQHFNYVTSTYAFTVTVKQYPDISNGVLRAAECVQETFFHPFSPLIVVLYDYSAYVYKSKQPAGQSCYDASYAERDVIVAINV
eukprot:jgi/Chlat1/4302/Chrsp29S04606